MPTSFRIALYMFLFSGAGLLLAQQQPAKLDLSVTYIGERSLKASTSQNFWMQGGSIELGANLYRGWGIAADVTGTHTGSIGTSGLPSSLVTTTFGPRYRWHADRRLSLYGQGLIGEANGFRSIFPATAGSQSDANGFAAQVGGGIDYGISYRFPFESLMRRGCGHSYQTAQTTYRTICGSALVSCCASHTNEANT